DEACPFRKIGCLLDRLLLEGVHARLKCLELRLEVAELIGPGTGGGHHGERYATEKGPAEPLGIGHYRFSHRSLELRLPPIPLQPATEEMHDGIAHTSISLASGCKGQQ